MAGNVVKKNIAEIADMLSLKQKNNQNMVLFLGSRAGGLFRSQDFIETMKKYSKRNFDLLSREGQFAECFNVLKQKNFNDNNIHALLTEFLKPVTFSESDIYLAEFIKRGTFDVIITANIDSLLENVAGQKASPANSYYGFLWCGGHWQNLIFKKSSATLPG